MEKNVASASTRRFLAEAMADFEVCARRAIECILTAPTFMPKGLRLSQHLLADIPFTCSILTGNAAYSATLSLGVNLADFQELMPGNADPGMLMDAIGEVANVVAGNLFSRDSLRVPFGCMLPTPPSFSQADESDGKSWCIHGMLTANGARVFLNLMIKSKNEETNP